jgi:hypothetical protein
VREDPARLPLPLPLWLRVVRAPPPGPSSTSWRVVATPNGRASSDQSRACAQLALLLFESMNQLIVFLDAKSCGSNIKDARLLLSAVDVWCAACHCCAAGLRESAERAR